MELYLMQHGEASSKDEDPDRPLTDRGRAEVERVARVAARVDVAPYEVRHSGKTRARQSAEILARALGVGAREAPGLAPNDDPATTRAEIEGLEEQVALVGHLPHLDRLASLLVAGDPERGVVAFENGGLVALVRDEAGWRVRWIATPGLVAD